MVPSTKRLELNQLLKEILGSENVYFQPKDGQNLSYPAIVYKLETVRSDFADGMPYRLHDRYQVTYIDRSPDSDIPKKLQSLPLCRFTAYFAKDQLNHYNHSIYY